jgi:putative DNA primase/helicase
VSFQPDFTPVAPDIDPTAIARFAEVVFGYTEGNVPVRILPEKGTPDGKPWIELFAADHTLAASLVASARRAAQAGRALYVVPATVTHGASARREDLAETAVILVDLDTGQIRAKRDYLARYLGEPTLEVASGGLTEEGESKLHLYWRLTEGASGADLDLVADVREGIAMLGGGDPSFARLSQPIRVAGSLHGKFGKLAPVRIVADTCMEHDLRDIADRLRDMPPFRAQGATIEIDASESGARFHVTDLKQMVVREGGVDGITRFLAISKVAGHVIRAVRQGRLTEEAARASLHAYNRDHISPPWDGRRLDHEFTALLNRDRAQQPEEWDNGADRRAALEAGAPLPPPDWSDDAIAHKVVETCGADWRFVPAWGQWLRWTGARWVKDETRLIRETVRQTCREVANGNDKGNQAQRIASGKTITAVEKLVESDPMIARSADAFDANTMLFNCAAGIIDLKTGELRPHDRDAHITRHSPARLGGRCPNWLAFLGEVMDGDAAMIAYLRRVCGLCLTGSTRDQVFFFLHGDGANGKSVFLETVAHVLGDYAMSANPDAFMTTRGDRHTTELAGLRGARLVLAGEVEANRSWAESRIKQITGGETLRVHFMHRDEFEYRPTYKLIFAGNHRPELENVGEAMRRRLHLVPFTVTIPEDRRIPGLAKQLCEERDGILAWMLEGLADWKQRGLAPPPRVLAASAEYLEDEDTIGQWLEAHCEAGEGHSCPAAALYSDWSSYAQASGATVGSTRSLGEKLRSKGFRQGRSRSARFWIGLRLRRGCAE